MTQRLINALFAVALVALFVAVVPQRLGQESDRHETVDETPTRGEVYLVEVDYEVNVTSPNGTRSGFTRGFFSISLVEDGTFRPKARRTVETPETGHCVLVQTLVRFGSDPDPTNHEHIDCDSYGPLPIVETHDWFGNRIGALFLDKEAVKVTGDSYFFQIPKGDALVWEEFAGETDLLYTEVEDSEAGRRWTGLRYETLPFHGTVEIRNHGKIPWRIL